MRAAAVIAEFNPFHSGHRLLLQSCREKAGADVVAVVMSGNFVQRGAPACMDRRVRTLAALRCGADVVLELPLPYAMATAERFAFGAVSVLAGLGGVELLAFGSECGDLSLLQSAAHKAEQAENSQCFRLLLQKGYSFAQARQGALEEMGEGGLLRSPNNALAVEYLRQLKLQKAQMEPFTIPRQGAGHDEAVPRGAYASGSMLREALFRGREQELCRYLPPEIFALTVQGAGELADVTRGERAILSRLRGMTHQQFSRLPDCSEGIENRLYKAVRQACTLEQLYAMIKTKRYTLARVRRLVLSAFLQVDGSLCRQSAPYAHLLGFTPAGKALLSRWKSTAAIPLSPSLRLLERQNETAQRFARLEAAADDQYAVFLPQLRPCGYAYTAPVVTIGENKTEESEYGTDNARADL